MQKEDFFSMLLRKGTENVSSVYILVIISVLVSLMLLYSFIRYIVHMRILRKKQKEGSFSLSLPSVPSKTGSSDTEIPHDRDRWENEGGPIYKDVDL